MMSIASFSIEWRIVTEWPVASYDVFIEVLTGAEPKRETSLADDADGCCLRDNHGVIAKMMEGTSPSSRVRSDSWPGAHRRMLHANPAWLARSAMGGSDPR